MDAHGHRRGDPHNISRRGSRRSQAPIGRLEAGSGQRSGADAASYGVAPDAAGDGAGRRRRCRWGALAGGESRRLLARGPNLRRDRAPPRLDRRRQRRAASCRGRRGPGGDGLVWVAVVGGRDRFPAGRGVDGVAGSFLATATPRATSMDDRGSADTRRPSLGGFMARVFGLGRCLRPPLMKPIPRLFSRRTPARKVFSGRRLRSSRRRPQGISPPAPVPWRCCNGVRGPSRGVPIVRCGRIRYSPQRNGLRPMVGLRR